MAAADATAAMTIDFLRARLLSERSVSRAAKERADHLARRVAELEEQLRAVTAQRRKAERATAEVLAILDSQGFGRLSDGSEDDADTCDPGAAERDCGGNAAPLSGPELGALAAAAAAAGGLSWKGRAAGPDCDRRRPSPQQQKGRQVRQRHGHGHRRGYLFSRAADSLPKYHPGQSCRKIKRKELRSQPEGEYGKDNTAESAEEGQERSDCTVCTDEQPDFDGEGSQDGRGSCSNGRVEHGGDECAMDYGKDGEMERVLEKQAELIGQYEAEENAQREWEKKFSENRDSTVDSIQLNQTQIGCRKKESAQTMEKEVVCEQVRSSENYLVGINNPSEYWPKGSAAELCQNAAKDSAIEQCKVGYYDHEFGKNAATVASVDVELQVRNTKSYAEVVEGSGSNLGKPAPSPKGSCDSSQNAGHDKGQGDEISDSGSSYHVNACSSQRYLNTSSVESHLSDTPKSEVSEWSSSCFHNHIDNQLDTQLHQPSSDDVGGVLEALQRAKMSLRAKLSPPSARRQSILALPAPDDLPVNDMQLSLSQEILALPAPADYLNRMLPRGDVSLPLGHDGLFRLPTDLFPRNEMGSSDGYGSRFSLTAANRNYEPSSYPANHVMPTPSFAQFDSGLSPDPCHNPHGLSVPTAGGCTIPMSNFRIGDTSLLPEVQMPGEDFRRVRASGDARTHFQYGHD